MGAWRRTLPVWVLGGLVLLAGCGQPVAPLASAVTATSSMLVLTPTPLFGLPGPDVWQTESAAAATREALYTPVPTWPPGTSHHPPTLPPSTPYYISGFDRSVGNGTLYESLAPDLPSSVADIENWWDGELNGQIIRVYAGSKEGTANYDQGIVVVRVYDEATKQLTAPMPYETPQRAGRVRIVDGVRYRLTLRSDQGVFFYFDAVARQWVSGTPVPSPAPEQLATDTSSVELHTLPSPQDVLATGVAFQTALAERDAALRTSIALSPHPTSPGGPGPMLETPGPTATWGATWFECGSPNSGSDPQFYSCWQGTVNGVRLYLRAGSEGYRGETRQGLLEVDEVDNRSPYPDFMKMYQTPQKVGAVRIAVVNGTRVTLLPRIALPTPVTFVFDLATRQWVTP